MLDCTVKRHVLPDFIKRQKTIAKVKNNNNCFVASHYPFTHTNIFNYIRFKSYVDILLSKQDSEMF